MTLVFPRKKISVAEELYNGLVEIIVILNQRGIDPTASREIIGYLHASAEALNSLGSAKEAYDYRNAANEIHEDWKNIDFVLKKLGNELKKTDRISKHKLNSLVP